MTAISRLRKFLNGSLLSFICLLSYTQDDRPVINYNYFVEFLNENYGLFPYKNVDWDSLSSHYSTCINDNTSPDSLFFTICRLAAHLKDKHLWIDNDKYAFNHSISKVVPVSQMDSIFASREIFKNKSLIIKKYLTGDYQKSGINNFLWGKIGNNTGYLSLDWFDKDLAAIDSVLDIILKSLSDCSNLIIDIRNNIGGTDPSAQKTANYFVETGECYQIAKKRTGKNTDSYSDTVYWYTNPESNSFTKPVLVLINKFTMSAAEAFSLALRNNNHIRFLGEPSAGAFSDAEDAYLPNGWHFTYSVGVWTDSKGVLWEEKGIQPNITLEAPVECFKDTDPYLDLAIQVLAQ